MDARTATTVDAIIELFGGPSAAASALGTTPQAVVNWRARGTMPSRLFITHKRLLEERGIDAPASLWGMDEPAEAAA